MLANMFINFSDNIVGGARGSILNALWWGEMEPRTLLAK